MLIIIIVFVALIIGYILRFIYAKLNAKSIEQISNRIIKESKLIAETKSKESLLEAKLMIDRERKEFECEIKEKRHFIHNAENRLNQRESNLDRKMDV
ncbi:MAG: Rnase Y domain-containing protein, partial [Endomicrobium sp.]|nr:Rnase Y domain-containing protein [Endomicrobium sp.]